MPVIFTQQRRRAWQKQVASDSSHASDKVTANLLAAQWPAGHKPEFTGGLVGHRDFSCYNGNWRYPVGKGEGSL